MVEYSIILEFKILKKKKHTQRKESYIILLIYLKKFLKIIIKLEFKKL